MSVLGGNQIVNVSLHTFVDASENAFGAVAYVSYSYQDGTISINIVAAIKGKGRTYHSNKYSTSKLGGVML